MPELSALKRGKRFFTVAVRSGGSLLRGGGTARTVAVPAIEVIGFSWGGWGLTAFRILKETKEAKMSRKGSVDGSVFLRPSLS